MVDESDEMTLATDIFAVYLRRNSLIPKSRTAIKIGCYTFLVLSIQSVQLLRIYIKKAQKGEREKIVRYIMRKEEKLWVLRRLY